MNKKIKISEAQIKEIKKVINEGGMVKAPGGNQFVEISNAFNPNNDNKNTTEQDIDTIVTSLEKNPDINKLINSNTAIIRAGETPQGNEIYAKPTKESVIISKKQLKEAQLKKLKENSEIIRVKDFITK